MSDVVIHAEHLGKRYPLRHARQERYTTLRDVIARKAGGFLKKLKAEIQDGGAQNQFQLSKPQLSAFPATPAADEDFWALKDVSFEIKQGEVLGIIGRNGAGKSTLLKILSRITEPTEGRVTIRGRLASLLEVGTGFHPELTGRENIHLNGAILGLVRADIRQRLDEIAAFAEVEKFLDMPVKHYSSGMQMRLAFSVAAHLDPDVLVVDEVLAVGDAAFQAKCLQKLDATVTTQGRTVIFVSHNMDSVMRLATRCLVLDKGRVFLDNAPKTCVERYIGSFAGSHSTVELDERPRPAHVRGNARLMRVTAEGGGQAWAVPFGADIAFELDVKVTAPLPFASVGIGLFAASGVEVASALSSHSLAPQVLVPGSHRFSFRYEGLRLVPGVYHLGIGIESGRGPEDYVRNAVEFTVVSNALSAQWQTDGFRGYVVPQTKCSLRLLPVTHA